MYTLKPTDMTATKYEEADATIDTANVSVKDNVKDAGTRVYGEDESVYITVDTDVVDTTGEKKIAVTDVDGMYTGVQSVDLEIDPISKKNEVEAQVYTVYDKDNYVIGAVVLGEASGKGNYAYIVSAEKSEEKIGDTYYWEFEAILDGELQTLTAKSEHDDIFNVIKANKFDVVELRFDADNYVIDAENATEAEIAIYDYNDATEGPDAADIDDCDVYFVRNTDSKDVWNGTDLVLNLKGRTLYITPDQDDLGLAIASDAKAVVIQDENNKTDVKTEFTSVSSAISHLADADPTTTPLEYKGKIFAVLNDNGTAAWVVFDSITPLSTSTGGIIDTTNNSVRNGNVTLVGDNTVTVSGVSMNNNLVSYSFTVKAADGAEDVTYDVDVYVDGQNVWTYNDSSTTNRSGMVSGNVTVAAGEDATVRVEVSNASVVPTAEPVQVTLTVTNDALITLDGETYGEGVETLTLIDGKTYTVTVKFADGATGVVNYNGSAASKFEDDTYSFKASKGGQLVVGANTASTKVVSSVTDLKSAINDEKVTEIYLDAGTYELTDTLMVGDHTGTTAKDRNLTIIGVYGKTTIKSDQDWAVNFNADDGTLTLENITFEYIGDDNGFNCAVQNQYNNVADNITFKINRCIFDGYDYAVQLIKAAGGSEVTNCIFKNNNVGVSVGSAAGSVTLSGNTYENNAEFDIELFGTSEQITNVNVKDNVSEDRISTIES